MPDLLLELFSEEIPARMQRKAADDLRRLVTDALVEAGLVYEGAKAFATPRRLALTVHGVPARSPDRREERKGPRVGAPDKAIQGFLRGAGLASIDDAEIQSTRKGDVYVAVIEQPGRPAEEVIADIVPAVVRDFPWPKSMRWGAASAKPGSLAWVRPLHSILCVFGPETEDTEIVPFAIDGMTSGDTTHGHRFMAPEAIRVSRFDDYAPKLEKAKVVLDADRRKDIILADARDRALALGLELVEDEGLLEEVAGLVEWPVVLVGAFEEDFLDIPPEVIRTTIRANQKCFVLQEARSAGGATGNAKNLANRFVLVANIEAPDDGKAIVAGNERVIRARLADARHFWQVDQAPLPDHDTPEMRAAADRLNLDLARPLDQRMAKLAATNVVFHDKLGTQGERVARIVRLAGEIADALSRQPNFFDGKLLTADDLKREQAAFRERVERAAVLAKADLTSEMVGEFPELQGLIGRYYAEAQGEEASVATAIEDHYKPVGPSDSVPSDPVAIAVALAEKLDMLVGFWAIDEKPTGSKDPYALRRAALGVIRIVLENKIRLGFTVLANDILVGWFLSAHARSVSAEHGEMERLTESVDAIEFSVDVFAAYFRERNWDNFEAVFSEMQSKATACVGDLLVFFHDRLKVQLREQGARHDLVDAVLGDGAEDDLLLIVRKVEALGKFLDTEDGRNLLAGTKRAANILADEEKKSGETFDGPVDPALLTEAGEIALFEAVGAATGEAAAAVEVEDFDDAMTALAKLRAPVDAFFDAVRVNAEDAGVRANRLRLLNQIRAATRAVADFSKIEG